MNKQTLVPSIVFHAVAAAALAAAAVLAASPAAARPTRPDPFSASSAVAAVTSAFNQAGRTGAEQQLHDSPFLYAKTVAGGIFVEGGTACAKTFIDTWLRTRGNEKAARDACKREAVKNGLEGARKGHLLALEERAARERLSVARVAADSLRQDNDYLQAVVTSSQQVVAEGRARVDALKADVQASKASASQAQEAMERERTNLQAMEQSLADARKTLADYEKARSQMARGDQQVDAQISRMQGQVRQLERNISDYAAALRVSGA